MKSIIIQILRFLGRKWASVIQLLLITGGLFILINQYLKNRYEVRALNSDGLVVLNSTGGKYSNLSFGENVSTSHYLNRIRKELEEVQKSNDKLNATLINIESEGPVDRNAAGIYAKIEGLERIVGKISKEYDGINSLVQKDPSALLQLVTIKNDLGDMKTEFDIRISAISEKVNDTKNLVFGSLFIIAGSLIVPFFSREKWSANNDQTTNNKNPSIKTENGNIESEISYQLKETWEGKFYFIVSNDRGRLLLQGELHDLKVSCLNAMNDAQRASSSIACFQELTSPSGSHFFHLNAEGGQRLATSELYPGKGKMELDIDVIKMHGKLQNISH